MKYITVQDIKIPALGYGTWKLSDRECIEGVSKALEIGYRHIDTAQIYQNEEQVGQAISLSGLRREEIFLTTKIWKDNLDKHSFYNSFAESIRKLKTNYVDLILIHWPVETIPFQEQLDSLMQIQKTGQARLIGVSNFTVEQLQQVKETIGAPVVNNQVEYHAYLSQKPVLDYLRSKDMFLTAYSPVGRGKVLEDKAIQTIAGKYSKSAAQIALRWLVQQDNVAAIPKAAKEAHARSNFEIFDFELTEQEMRDIHNLAQPSGRMVDPDWAPNWDRVA